MFSEDEIDYRIKDTWNKRDWAIHYRTILCVVRLFALDCLIIFRFRSLRDRIGKRSRPGTSLTSVATFVRLRQQRLANGTNVPRAIDPSFEKLERIYLPELSRQMAVVVWRIYRESPDKMGYRRYTLTYCLSSFNYFLADVPNIHYHRLNQFLIGRIISIRDWWDCTEREQLFTWQYSMSDSIWDLKVSRNKFLGDCSEFAFFSFMYIRYI